MKLYALEGHHSWTDEEIAAFEAGWPIGTKERTAFALFLFTGQRLGDVRRMSWRDLDGPGINVTQGKTKERLWIPLRAEPVTILEQRPRLRRWTTCRTTFPNPPQRFGKLPICPQRNQGAGRGAC